VRARPAAAFLTVAAACSLAACGAERHTLPAETVARDAPHNQFRFPSVGLRIELPRVASPDGRKAPGVFRASLGQSFIAAYAYRRREQLPRNARELEAARRRLVSQIRKRDSRFRLVGSRATRAGGAPAVEVVGDQRIAGGTFRTRSLHAYRGQGEYVLDMLAPLHDFPEMDRSFFSPAVRSLEVTGKVERRGRT
jgi:hypothetical protein